MTTFTHKPFRFSQLRADYRHLTKRDIFVGTLGVFALNWVMGMFSFTDADFVRWFYLFTLAVSWGVMFNRGAERGWNSYRYKGFEQIGPYRGLSHFGKIWWRALLALFVLRVLFFCAMAISYILDYEIGVLAFSFSLLALALWSGAVIGADLGFRWAHFAAWPGLSPSMGYSPEPLE